MMMVWYISFFFFIYVSLGTATLKFAYLSGVELLFFIKYSRRYTRVYDHEYCRVQLVYSIKHVYHMCMIWLGRKDKTCLVTDSLSLCQHSWPLQWSSLPWDHAAGDHCAGGDCCPLDCDQQISLGLTPQINSYFTTILLTHSLSTT